MHPRSRPSSLFPRALVFAIILFAVWLITRVYPVYSPTWDEPSHIGNGMAMLGRPHHMIDPVDPPLPRVAVAIGPWLDGARPQTADEPYASGNQILKSTGNYRAVLTAARLGTLFFFLVTVLLVWLIAKERLGAWAAVIACSLLVFDPPVLANASIATTDMAFTAMYLAAVLSLWLVSDRVTWRRCFAAGATSGLAIASKFSGVPFLLATAGLLLVFNLITRRKLPRLRELALMIVTVAATIWTAYGFQVGQMATSEPSRAAVARMAAKAGFFRPLVLFSFSHVPAYQFFQGVLVARQFGQHPPQAYLFGQTFTTGHPYFFLVLLLAKTPIPFLILGGAGFLLLLLALVRTRDSFTFFLLIGILVPIGVATFAHVYLGLRHVLPVYPFLAIAGAYAARAFWRTANLAVPVKAAMVSVLLAWGAVDCVHASPDYLPWYNEAAAPYAAYIHVDSDYDWGQDLRRLALELQALHASHVALCYSGSADPNQFGMPSWYALEPGQPATGWIAISQTHMVTMPGKFAWLGKAQPVARAGKTILIYHLPATGNG